MMKSRQYILILVLFFVGITRTAGQKAILTADTTEGCDSILVHFKSNSILAGKTLQYYVFKFGDGTSTQQSIDSTATKLYNKSGMYNAVLEMKIANFNTYTDTVKIFVRPHPNAYFTYVDTFKIANLAYYFRSGKAPTDTINYRYVWTLNPKSNGTFEYRETHKRANDITPISATDSVKRDTLFYRFSTEKMYKMRLKVTDYYGCVDSLDTTIEVFKELQIPNIFTPNGDHVNDFFEVHTDGRTVFSLQIFTMTGQLIFKSESRSIIWDGRLTNGSIAIPGTYLYIIDRVSGDYVKSYKGFVLLLREK